MRKNDKFDAFLKEHVGAVTLFARATCGVNHLVDDIVQETFIRAWRYYPTLRAEHSARSWVIRICRNVQNDFAPKWRQEPNIFLGEHADTSDAYGTSDIFSLMQALSKDHREVLVLCGFMGYDYETVSEVLEVPIGTVRSRLARARAIMTKLLEDTEAIPATEIA
jgi:RNA polymerase sigma-70 factor (ECF subfamily)